MPLRKKRYVCENLGINKPGSQANLTIRENRALINFLQFQWEGEFLPLSTGGFPTLCLWKSPTLNRFKGRYHKGRLFACSVSNCVDKIHSDL